MKNLDMGFLTLGSVSAPNSAGDKFVAIAD